MFRLDPIWSPRCPDPQARCRGGNDCLHFNSSSLVPWGPAEPVPKDESRLSWGRTPDWSLSISERQYGSGEGFRSVPALATHHREALAAINGFLEELSLCMNRHPLIRHRSAGSAKWPRWRRVQFQRPFARSMGSAACEAIVSSFFVNFSRAGAALWRRKIFWHPVETVASKSSPFDIAVMKSPARRFRRDLWFRCFPLPFSPTGPRIKPIFI